jgi:hypothetical protein
MKTVWTAVGILVGLCVVAWMGWATDGARGLLICCGFAMLIVGVGILAFKA